MTLLAPTGRSAVLRPNEENTRITLLLGTLMEYLPSKSVATP